jgi:hypothetical protein
MKLTVATAAALALLQPAAAEKQISQATVGGGDDMCAGYDDTDPAKVYYGPCESKATFTTDSKPYFTSTILGFGLVKVHDKAYLTDAAKISQIDAVGGSLKIYSADKTADGYAYLGASVAVSSKPDTCKGGGGKVGTCASVDSSMAGVNGMLGAAYFLNTGKQGTISAKTNEFPFYTSTADPLASPGGTATACISPISGGACGELPFSLCSERLPCRADGKCVRALGG